MEDKVNAGIQSGDLPHVTQAYTSALYNWDTVDLVVDLNQFVNDKTYGLSQEEIDEYGNRVPGSYAVEEGEEVEEEKEVVEEPLVEEVMRKFYVDNVEVQIVHEMVYELDPEGNKLKTWKFTDYTRDKVRELYPSANELRSKWTKTEERQQISASDSIHHRRKLHQSECACWRHDN